MQTTFPSSVDSVEEWLSALYLSKYAESFVAAGVSPSQLPGLTDERLKEIGIGLAGHRKRLLLACKELNAGSAAASCVADQVPLLPSSDCTRVTSEPPPPGETARRANSTSSIYVQSTITKPDIEELIFCLAIVIHDRILQGEHMPFVPESHYFSEENNPIYVEPEPNANNDKKKKKREPPSEETIFYTIRSVYDCARFPAECLIISLVYMERLMAVSSIQLSVTSWRPIFLAALIVSQKVWDDRSLHNIDFSVFCPMFTLKEINHLEKKFLELISYDVSVNSSLYASYHFQLRTLCQKSQQGFVLQPMQPSVAATLEARGLAYTEEFKQNVVNKTWQSTGDIEISGRLRSMGIK